MTIEYERQWCNSCQMNAANGCRHPLGPTYCPHRPLKPKPEIKRDALGEYVDTPEPPG